QDMQMKDNSGQRGDSRCWTPAGITEGLRPEPREDMGDQQVLCPSLSSIGAYTVYTDTTPACQLEHLAGWSVCHAADGEHGEYTTGHVQKKLQRELKLLAKKVFTLHSLVVRQLSKHHYDLARTSSLHHPGKKLCSFLSAPNEEILLMAMKDMDINKLTSADLPLQSGITQDLFPAVETPIIDYGKLHWELTSFFHSGWIQK
ncbi:hypothetical protein ABVT39_009135, partial [Epinephelus coioides]